MQNKIIFPLLLFIFCSFNLIAQSFWTKIEERNIVLPEKAKQFTMPQKYTTFELELTAFRSALRSVPKEASQLTQNIRIPMPNGTLLEFEVYETNVMHPDLAARYPMIKTYKGYSKDKSAIIRFDLSTKGFHAVINQDGHSIYIDPLAVHQDQYYMVYFTKDFKSPANHQFSCGVTSDELNEESTPTHEQDVHQHEDIVFTGRSSSDPVSLRKYRAAIATTAEYTNYHGGKEGALSAIVNALNRLNMIFERDLAITMELIPNNDEIIYLDASTDPYDNNSGDLGPVINANQTNLDEVIGFSNYDIGHVFGRGGYQGLASLQSVCDFNRKASAASKASVPQNDPFVVSIVAHEMGHQMGGNHTMSVCHNVNPGTAYEPGSGSTIMSYAGICGGNANIVGDADDYYFNHSLNEMYNYMHLANGDGCAEKIPVENTTPEINIPFGNNFYIPIRTPFELDASAIDAEGDAMTYSWEQYNAAELEIFGKPIGNCPLFRSYPPSTETKRVFPRIFRILNNVNALDEILPSYSRDLNFRFTVRDNNPLGGGVAWEDVWFKVTENAGPFVVTEPNWNAEWEVGKYVPIKWEVANTDINPINCKNVNIRLSKDGGYTYPILLLENTPNDGEEFIVIPDEVTTDARIRVEAADNIFFDVSNADFEIKAPSAPGFALQVVEDNVYACLPNPGMVEFEIIPLLDYADPIEFSVVDGLPDGALASFSNNSAPPSEAVIMEVDFGSVIEEATYELLVQVTGVNTDTSYRTITMTTISNDFSEFEPLMPFDGTSGVSGLPEFSWVTVEDADSYTVQISTNPSFNPSSIIDESSGIVEPPYNPTVTLEETTLYYWRVMPENECGKGIASSIQAFHTQSLNCALEAATDTPIFVSSSGTPTIESKISILPDGEISDINVTNLKGTHEYMSNLKIYLESPAGTRVLLLDRECLNYNGSFNLEYDDEAPEVFDCPPTGIFRPEQPLAAFNGETSGGLWKLIIEDNEGGGGGNFESWSLEFCANISLSDPVLVKNEVLEVLPNEGRNVSDYSLITEDPNVNPWDLDYTIVTYPKHGVLLFNGEELQVGDEFNQHNVNLGSIRYVHDGSDTEEDRFRFTVRNNLGGWTGTHAFIFDITPDATITSLDEVLDELLIEIYPNPVKDQLTVTFLNQNNDFKRIQLYDLQGKLLQSTTINAQSTFLNVSDFAKGVYLVKVQMGKHSITKKITVQ